jgi:hypothetical protein
MLSSAWHTPTNPSAPVLTPAQWKEDQEKEEEGDAVVAVAEREEEREEGGEEEEEGSADFKQTCWLYCADCGRFFSPPLHP